MLCVLINLEFYHRHVSSEITDFHLAPLTQIITEHFALYTVKVLAVVGQYFVQLALHLLQVYSTLHFFCFFLGTKTRDQKKGLPRGTVEKETKDKMN